MDNQELIEQMVQRLGQELKGLQAQAGQGQLSAAAVEGFLRQRLWHFASQVTTVLLESTDAALVANRAGFKPAPTAGERGMGVRGDACRWKLELHTRRPAPVLS